MLKTQAFYDATGGGAMIIVPNSGSSLTVQENVQLLGYAAYGQTDLDEIVMTVTGDSNWEASGLRFPNTWNSGTSFKGVQWLPHKIPLKANSVMAFTSVAGANPVYLLLYVDDKLSPSFSPPPAPNTGKAMYVSLTSAASGVNCTASSAQMNYATTTITAFTSPRRYKPISVARAASATGPSLAVGISKGNDQHVTWWPIAALADGVNEFYYLPASGLPEFQSGERCNIHWLTDAAEQPTAQITFAYSP
jgi:hypothetical protein